MNFLTVGSLFLLFQLNIDWTSNYIVKLIGFAFFVGGISELSEICSMKNPVKTGNEKADKFFSQRISLLSDIKGKAVTMCIMCAIAAVCEGLLKYVLKPADFAVNVISLILGAAVAFLSLNLFRMVYDFIEKHERFSRGNSNSFTDNEANVVRLGGAFYKLAVITLVNVAFDILNRLVPVAVISNVAGFVVAVSKILLYIFLLVVVFDFNKIRVDYNKKHDRVIE